MARGVLEKFTNNQIKILSSRYVNANYILRGRLKFLYGKIFIKISPRNHIIFDVLPIRIEFLLIVMFQKPLFVFGTATRY